MISSIGNKAKGFVINAGENINKAFKDYQEEVEQKRANYKHQRMIDALIGRSIYSKDFYVFMTKCGYGLYFEFCQDIYELHKNFNSKLFKMIENKYEMEEFQQKKESEQNKEKYDKYNFDDVFKKILHCSVLKYHWKMFESKISETKTYKMHDYQTNIGSLKVELIRIYNLKSKYEYFYNPMIKTMIGNQIYETQIKYRVEQVEYNQCYKFDIYNIKKEFLYFKVIDYKPYSKSHVIDWVKIDLSLIDFNQINNDKLWDIQLKNNGVITIKLDFERMKPFYYRDIV